MRDDIHFISYADIARLTAYTGRLPVSLMNIPEVGDAKWASYVDAQLASTAA